VHLRLLVSLRRLQQVTSVKIIRNKASGISEGYGFVEFRSHESAEAVLRTYNGSPIPNTDQIFRLNWAAFGVGKGTTEGLLQCSVASLRDSVVRPL
jgi:RNA recognition motif-containing protein